MHVCVDSSRFPATSRQLCLIHVGAAATIVTVASAPLICRRIGYTTDIAVAGVFPCSLPLSLSLPLRSSPSPSTTPTTTPAPQIVNVSIRLRRARSRDEVRHQLVQRAKDSSPCASSILGVSPTHQHVRKCNTRTFGASLKVIATSKDALR